MSTTKTITVPEKWSEVKYKDYYRFVKSVEGVDEEDQNTIVEMALLYLCGLMPEYLYSLPKSTYIEIVDGITKLLNDQNNQKLHSKINIAGVDYGFDPNLQEMSYGMYLDLTAYSKDFWANMPIIASILYRPIDYSMGNSYNTKKYMGTNDEVVSVFKEHLTMDTCLGMLGFFLTLQSELVKASLTSSLKAAKKIMADKGIIHQLEDSQISGEHIKHSLHLLEEISQNLKK